jgi:hypothetical protein
VSGGGGPTFSEYNSASAEYSTIGGGRQNEATNPYATTGGGWLNSADGHYSTVAGGWSNVAEDLSSTVGGGDHNSAGGQLAVVGGGFSNAADGNAAVVGGGTGNSATGYCSVVSGGLTNSVSGSYSTIAGGESNNCSSANTFVCGSSVNTAAENSFVFSDGSGDPFTPGLGYTFNAKASGGVRLYTNTTASIGAQLPANGSAWVAICDSTKKHRYGRVNTEEVLDKVAQLPIETWSYREDPNGIRHIGPMAQDFYAAFGVGESDTTISTLDPDGVALAAIQELAKRTQKIDELELELAALRAQLQTLIAGDSKALRKEK